MNLISSVYEDDAQYIISRMTEILSVRGIVYYVSKNDKSMENVLEEVKKVTGSDLLLMRDEDILSVVISLHPDIDKISFLTYLRDSSSFDGYTIKFSYFGREFKARIDLDLKPRVYIDSGNGYVFYDDLDDAVRKIQLMVNYGENTVPVNSDVFEEVLVILRAIIPYYNFTYYLSADADGFDELYAQVAKICGTTDITIILNYVKKLEYSTDTIKRFWDYLASPYNGGNRTMLVVRTRRGHIVFKHHEGVISKVIHEGKTYTYDTRNILSYLGMILDVRMRKSAEVPDIWLMYRCSEIAQAMKVIYNLSNNSSVTFAPTHYGISLVVKALKHGDFDNVQKYLQSVRSAHFKTCPTEVYSEEVYLIERLRILLGIPFYDYTAHYQGKSMEISPRYPGGVKASFNLKGCRYITDIISRFFGMEEKTNDNTNTEH